MGAVMVIVDGMGDIPSFYPPELVQMGKRGAYGAFCTCPQGFSVDTLPCVLTLLGVSSSRIPQGRGALEADARDIPLSQGEAAFRCNLVTLDGEGRLASSCGEGLTAAEKRRAFTLAAPIFREAGMQFFPLEDYRALAIVKADPRELKNIRTYRPHAHLGEPLSALLPRGGGLAGRLAACGVKSQKALAPLGHGAVLPWDGAGAPSLPRFSSLHGLKGAAVCRTDVVQGLAKAMQMDLFVPSHATGDVDTDLGEKAGMAARLSEAYDFVLLHLNGADEASHRRNREEKEKFLRRVGKQVVSPLLLREELPLLVCSDHSTMAATGEHRSHPQPFFLRKMGVKGNLGLLSGKRAVELVTEQRKGE